MVTVELLKPPPAELPRNPDRHVVPEGTKLYRVHHRDYRPDAFNARPEDVHFLGTRFGGTAEDSYPCFYAAPAPETAVVETLLHDARFGADPMRPLSRDAVRDLLLSTVYLNMDVELVSLLRAKSLAAVAADGWLVHCDRDSYALTRRWGHWIRSHARWAQGFVWPSKRDVGNPALVLFDDRVGESARVDYRPFVVPTGEAPRDFGKDSDIGWLNEVLEPYQATVMDGS